jgi:valyl-tRNA synthetase
MGMRHNLPFVNIFTPDAHITLAEFEEQEKKNLKELEGLDRFKARDRVVEMLQEKGFLIKVEDYETSIGHCYRCKTSIEPYLSDQWFVKVKPLAEKAIAAVEEGKIKFVPERWTKVYLQWMTNLRDWCISRQLWWGHQIPAWYKGEEIYVGEEPPKGDGWVQDPDVFDTWFSSALWPFSTLGWPDETEDLKTFYPTDVLVTSYDIIFFWVARMIMAGLHFMGKAPFHTVYFNALVKDIHGKKMSKSWGNVIDPLDVIERAGADALRFAFISLIAGQGQDVKLSEDKITEARNFANKIWNVSRFVLINSPPIPLSYEERGRRGCELELADRWILSRYNQTIKKVTESIENYEFGEAARSLYDFIWAEFCDWYVEIAKIRLYGQDEKAKATVLSVLLTVLSGTLRLLHPFMPFITEEIYQRINTTNERMKSIMLEKWPEADEKMIDVKVEEQINILMEVVRGIRNIRAEFNVPHSKEVEVILVTDKAFEESYIKVLAKVGRITIVKKMEEKPKQSASIVISGVEIYVPLAGLIDFEKEIGRLKKEDQAIDLELGRIAKLLADDNFVSRATPEAVEKQKAREKELKEKKKIISERLKDFAI